MRLANAKVGVRLAFAFSLILFITLVIAGIGVWRLQELADGREGRDERQLFRRAEDSPLDEVAPEVRAQRQLLFPALDGHPPPVRHERREKPESDGRENGEEKRQPQRLNEGPHQFSQKPPRGGHASTMD